MATEVKVPGTIQLRMSVSLFLRSVRLGRPPVPRQSWSYFIGLVRM